MIHFRCPRCNVTLAVPDGCGGQKTHCGKCGQRLQIPVPPPNKTILAPFVAVNPTPPPPVPPAPAPPPPQPPPELTLTPPPEPSPVRKAPRPADYDVIEEEPRRRDYDDEPPRRPRRRSHFVCPYCGTDEPPYMESQISTAGWVLFVVLLIACFPFCILGLFVKEQYRVCSGCGVKIG